MSVDGQGTKWHRKIAENFNQLSKAHEHYRWQTDRLQTDGQQHIANVSSIKSYCRKIPQHSKVSEPHTAKYNYTLCHSKWLTTDTVCRNLAMCIEYNHWVAIFPGQPGTREKVEEYATGAPMSRCQWAPGESWQHRGHMRAGLPHTAANLGL